MVRLCNRLLRMDDNRLSKKVFDCDMHTIGARASEVHDLCVARGCENVFSFY